MKKSILNLLDTYEGWLSQGPLEIVIVNIHKIYLEDPQLLNGEILGILAKRLTSSEIQPGGPYVSADNLYLNTLIMRLFRTLGTPLKNLEKFLEGKEYIPKNSYESKILSIPLKRKETLVSTGKQQHSQAIKKFEHELSSYTLEIQQQAILFLQKIIQKDKHKEISQISTYFIKSLMNLTDNNLVKSGIAMGSANICAWIAYTIYDDFVDDEGDASFISLANIMQRLSFQMYEKEFPHAKTIINDHFNSVDISNLWEIKNCRMKIYKDLINIEMIPKYYDGEFLAERAIGHILGPKLVIETLNLSTLEKNSIYKGLKDYLIAKQINDDITDWQKDLEKGHINFVLSKLLETCDIKNGTYNLKNLINTIKPIFWDKVFQECMNIGIKKIDNSIEALSASKVFISNNIFIQKVLLTLKKDMEFNLLKHLNEKEFLRVYN